MQTVKEIMTKDPIRVSPDTELARVVQILLEKHINGVPVTDAAGKVVGIVCQSDLIAQQKRLNVPSLFSFLDGVFPFSSMKQVEREIKKISEAVVGDIMTPDPVTVTPDTDIETVATLMVEKKYHTLPVVENGLFTGIVGKEDVLRTLITD